MEPTLPDECLILYDRGQRRRRERRTFLVRTEAGSIVKRAARRGQDWGLAGDNSVAVAEPWSADVETIGEVVWVTRTLI